MTITISRELEARLRNRAEAEGVSMESYVETLIRRDEEWGEQSEEPLDASDQEFAEVRSAVTEGLAQAERGEGRPAEEVFAELRATNRVIA